MWLKNGSGSVKMMGVENKMSLNDISKYIALILRHKPEEIGISLDEHGWTNVSELIEGISKTYPFNMEKSGTRYQNFLL